MKPGYGGILLFLLVALCAAAGWAGQKIQVVTTTTDLMDIARQIGGDRVDVVSLSHGDQSGCNSVEPRPSMVMKVRAAGLLVRIGMGYDSWADSLIDAARNARVTFGSPGYVDTSVGIQRLEVPAGKIDAGMGHMHAYGNPHYWLAPENGQVIAENITEGLRRVSPENQAYFIRNKEAFIAELARKTGEWQRQLAGYKGRKCVSYHQSWAYFARSFGLDLIAAIEPKPGIPPSPAHVNTLIEALRQHKGFIILHENIYPVATSRLVAESAGGKLLVLPIATGGMNGTVKSYIGLFDYIVARIAEQ